MSDQTESIVPSNYLHDDVQAVAEYRSVSKLSVAAIVLGVASALAMISSGLLMVPLLGVIASLLALRQIAASDGQMVGRTAALLGLALSLAFGAGIYAREVAMQRLVVRESQHWSLEWCQLLMDGEILTALELRTSPNIRRPFDETLQDYYETNDSAIESLAMFREDPVAQLLLNAPDDSRIEPGEVLEVERLSSGDFLVTQHFILSSPSQSEKGFRLRTRRKPLSGSQGSAWYLTDLEPGK